MLSLRRLFDIAARRMRVYAAADDDYAAIRLRQFRHADVVCRYAVIDSASLVYRLRLRCRHYFAMPTPPPLSLILPLPAFRYAIFVIDADADVLLMPLAAMIRPL